MFGGGAMSGMGANLGKFLSKSGKSIKDFAGPMSAGGMAGHGLGMSMGPLAAAGRGIQKHPYMAAGGAGLAGMGMGELGDDEVDQEDEIAQLLQALGLV